MMARLYSITDVDHEFKSLRISAIRNAIEIAPYVKETTIGPDSFKINMLDSHEATPQADIMNSILKQDSSSSLRGKDSAAHNGDFTYEKILHECELKRRETANVMFHNMLNKMVAKRSEMMTKFWHQQELEYEKRSQERRNREIEILQELALGDRMAKLEQEKLDDENRAHSERMKNLLEKQLESTKLFENLNNHHYQMCSLYEEITNISSSDNIDFANILKKFEPSLSSVLSSMNLITERCKSGCITEVDVGKAASLTSKMRDLKSLVIEELRNALEIAEKKILEAKINTQKAVTNTDVTSHPPMQAVKQEAPVQSAKVKYCSEKSFNIYVEYKQFLTSYEASYKSLLEDDSLKKFRFDCQKAVNTPVNAISAVSGSHLKDKYDKLLKLLSGDRVRVGDVYVSCSVHPQGIAYCTDLLARKLVRQGDLLVSSSPEAAFAIASLTVALWARFPDLGKLIIAHFHQECPYLIPMMMPQCQGQTDEEFYKARGYRYNEDGTVEKQDKFLKRMSGVFRLCAAIWVTSMPHSVNCTHPQGLAHAWRWMAAFINLEPEADITATLLYDFLTICGSQFFKHYQRQFVKVLNFLLTDYRQRIDKIDEGGPKTRLEVFLQNVIKEGNIAPPTGIIPGRLW